MNKLQIISGDGVLNTVIHPSKQIKLIPEMSIESKAGESKVDLEIPGSAGVAITLYKPLEEEETRIIILNSKVISIIAR